MATAMDVANYFLATLGADAESDLTHTKLQKLCSYSQALALALLEQPIFPEKIEAWTYGPVIPALYEKFQNYVRRPIPGQGLSEVYAREPFSDEEKFILELARSYYGIFSAKELTERSHRDFPGQFGSKKVIAPEAIKKAFASDPLVKKLKRSIPEPDDKGADSRVSEQEIWDALEV